MRPACERVDERELGRAVRGREREEVDELERAGRDEPGQCGGVDLPRRAANGAATTRLEQSATAVAASMSREPASRRFQTACRTAAPSASARAALLNADETQDRGDDDVQRRGRPTS